MDSASRYLEYSAPGQVSSNLQTGDFILTHNSGLMPLLIRFGQGLRYRGELKRYAYWNHAALILDAQGTIEEADGHLVKLSNLSEYTPKEYIVVHVQNLSDIDKAQIRQYAASCIGQRYGTLSIISLILSLLTGSKLSFGVDNQLICSGLVAEAEERGWADFDRDCNRIMPADLAKYYSVVNPAG